HTAECSPRAPGPNGADSSWISLQESRRESSKRYVSDRRTISDAGFDNAGSLGQFSGKTSQQLSSPLDGITLSHWIDRERGDVTCVKSKIDRAGGALIAQRDHSNDDDDRR